MRTLLTASFILATTSVAVAQPGQAAPLEPVTAVPPIKSESTATTAAVVGTLVPIAMMLAAVAAGPSSSGAHDALWQGACCR